MKAFLLTLCFLCPLLASGQKKSADFSFVPNQLAGNWWYRPWGSIINNHLDDSFGNPEVWPVLRENLRKSGGPFSIYASEIGFMHSEKGLLPLLAAEGIPISVEMHGFTQCVPADQMARAELFGVAIPGSGLFSEKTRITNPETGRGWFVTADGKDMIPGQVLFDERMPNLCPVIDEKVLASTKGTWEQRLAAARQLNGRCAVSALSWDELLPALREDYVKFLNVAKEKWGKRMPQVGVHWNVVAGWEWRDQKAISAVNAVDPEFYNNPDNFRVAYKRYPELHFNSVAYLQQLIDVLEKAGFKPSVILMDVDWNYDLEYSAKLLKMHKEALKKRGVMMGINIVEAELPRDGQLDFDGKTLVRSIVPAANPNLQYESTLVSIVEYLIASGIYEPGMQIRVGSWSPRPYEIGAQVGETLPGSLAHAANRIYELIKN